MTKQRVHYCVFLFIYLNLRGVSVYLLLPVKTVQIKQSVEGSLDQELLIAKFHDQKHSFK